METQEEIQPDDRGLVEHVRAMLTQDALPREPASHMWGGQGIGELCGICQRVISSEDTEFELIFATQVTLRLHRRCHAIWERERRRLAQ